MFGKQLENGGSGKMGASGALIYESTILQLQSWDRGLSMEKYKDGRKYRIWFMFHLKNKSITNHSCKQHYQNILHVYHREMHKSCAYWSRLIWLKTHIISFFLPSNTTVKKVNQFIGNISVKSYFRGLCFCGHFIKSNPHECSFSIEIFLIKGFP